MSTNEPISARPIRRRAVLGGGAVVAAGAAAAIVGPGVAAAGGTNANDVADKSQIYQLSINYGLGTDSISAKNKPRALELYSATFTDDAPISAGFDRANPSLVAIGPAAWADVVEQAFVGYSATQHHLATINIELTGKKTAQMSSYLHATHVLNAPSDQLLIVLGTYFDDVELRRAGWRIVRRFLQFTAFYSVARTAP